MSKELNAKYEWNEIPSRQHVIDMYRSILEGYIN